MKLLYTNFHEGNGGGHTTYIRELARALAGTHEVHVAAPPSSRLFAEAAILPNVQVLAQSFPNGLRWPPTILRAVRQLRDYLRTHQFDIVHVNGSADHRLLISAMKGMSPRPRIVLTKHNTKPMQGLRHVLRARRHTDKVIAVCEYVRLQLEATPYRVCQPQTVYNGVDTMLFAPLDDGQAKDLRAQLSAATDTLLIGSSAGTGNYKGWTDLVDALNLLDAQERRRVHVVIAGIPPTAKQLAQVHAANLQSQFHFPGLLEDVRPVIAALDAGFVLSHDVETISFACREMMSMGKPVMVTNYAGLPENIRTGEDGWVVPVHGHQAMAATLRQMLQDPQALHQMGDAARAHALAEFGIEDFVRATEAVYRELLSHR
ncbi:MAG: glycosyltransferase family 4 protein [Stenotrophomonas sp.]|uniref:glycosyltransferase family 4 protein n=1 Tax=Stenotrophomonas sp. TaxID=69392 RepID=UPI003D6D8B86